MSSSQPSHPADHGLEEALELKRPEINTRAVLGLVLYFEQLRGPAELEAVLEVTGLDRSYLEQEHNWVSLAYLTRLLEVMTERAGDPQLAYKAGLHTADPRATGIGYQMFASYLTPRSFYKRFLEMGPHFNRVGGYKVLELTDQSLTCVYQPHSDRYQDSFYGTEYRRGQLVAWPRLWHLPAAECQVKEIELDGRTAFHYTLTWEHPHRTWAPLVGAGIGMLVGLLPLLLMTGLSAWLLALISALVGLGVGLQVSSRRRLRHYVQAVSKHQDSLLSVNNELSAKYNESLEAYGQIRDLRDDLQEQLVELREAHAKNQALNTELHERVQETEAANALIREAHSDIQVLNAQLQQKIREQAADHATIQELNRKLEKQVNELEIANREANQALKLKEENQRMGAELNRRAQREIVKNQFFARVNHELRTPMTFIMPPVDAMLNDPDLKLPKTYRSMLNTMRTQGLKLLKLINSLLDLNKSEDHRMRLRYAPEDLNEIVECLVEDIRPSTGLHGLELEFFSDEDVPPLTINREKVEASILNLLSNAVKFTPEGGRITVSTGREAGQVFIRVSDTGPGIPADRLPDVFDRFSEVGTTVARGYGNTGLGLSVVKEFVEGLHHGRVTVESVEGQGATFTLWFPEGDGAARLDLAERRRGEADVPIERRRDDVLRASLSEHVTNAHDINMADFLVLDQKFDVEVLDRGDQRPRVLIVDDVPDIIFLLAGILNSEYNIVVARNRIEGEVAARTYLPDLIISDVNMGHPDDGFHLCASIKSDPLLAEIPVLLLTSRQEREDFKMGFSKGADDYLPKPFDMNELRARASLHVERRRNILELKRQKLELEKMQAELRRMATVDGLTQVFNRGHLEREGQKAFVEAQQSHQSLACIMLDIDHFKRFNTDYGHAGGDAVLRALGAFLNKWFSTIGVVARYGGEEFSVLLPAHDLNQAHRLAAAFLVEVRNHRFDSTHQFRITVSMGVAAWPECEVTSSETLLQCADNALFEAKVTRDAVVAARPSTLLAQQTEAQNA